MNADFILAIGELGKEKGIDPLPAAAAVDGFGQEEGTGGEEEAKPGGGEKQISHAFPPPSSGG